MEERKIKVGRFWLTKEVLESLSYLVKLQESTDKLRPCVYSIHECGYVVEFKIDDEYDIILEGVYYEER